MSEGPLHCLRPHPPGCGLHGPLPRTPDAVLAHELVDRQAGGGAGLDAREREQLLAQGPQDERRRLAFALQTVDDPQVARGVAAEQRLARGVGVIARHVCDRLAHSVDVELALGREERQLLHLLVRGEEISLDAIGEELERLARGALPLAREPLGDPRGKARALDRPTSTTTPALDRAPEPGARLAGAVQARQRTRKSMSGLGRSQYCAMASPPCTPGLPPGRRSSTIFFPPNSDRLASECASSLQSKLLPGSNTSRSVKPRARAAARTASAASSAIRGSSPWTT